MKELFNIQQNLHAPKDKRNTFGNYSYRSCEGILEAVKPLLADNNCTLTISDDVIGVGNFVFVKATATITNEAGEVVSNTAFARHDEQKKGMDSSQITGATSSYARKYALNGLFCIDDTKDADTDEFRNQNDAMQKRNAQSSEKVILQLCEQATRCNSMDELVALRNGNPDYASDPRFRDALNARAGQIRQAV